MFSGIGAFEKALSNIGVEYDLIGFSEIDKYAAESYCAIHNVNKSLNLGDITKIEKEKLPRFIDLITHGSPCQDFSVAGKQAGGDKGTNTRSSLMWDTVDIIEWCLPKYVVWENVKNLLSKKHRHNFDSYIEIMDKLGYNSYYQILNAKDYGIPQNRERVYTISIRKDIDKGNFKFPEKEELKLRLKDMLESEADEKYYLNEKQINKIQNSNFVQERKRIQETDKCDTLLARDYKDPKCVRVGGIFDTENSKHQAGSVYSKEGISPALDTMQGGYRQPCIEIGVDKNIKPSVAVNFEREKEQIYNTDKEIYQCSCKSGWQDNKIGIKVSPTLRANNNNTFGLTKEMRIRKLTPKECWRLMGFNDEDFEKAEKAPTSNTQLYKQAGNSIVVSVLEKIFKNLFKELI